MLDFRLSGDQRQIISAVTDTLAREPAYAGALGQVARFGELGWIGIAMPEECGGSGGTWVDGALVAYEVGRALASPDLLATQLAALVAFAAGNLDLARAFASGNKAAGFCLAAGESESKRGESAAYFLRTDPAAGYLRFRNNACEIIEVPKRERSGAECIDPGTVLRGGDASLCKVLAHVADSDGKLVQIAVILLAAMLAGIADSCRDLAVAYTKTRKQFGRFIGEFQAIKHHCSNMHLRARAAFAQTMHAAMLAAAELPGADVQAMAALQVSANAAVENSEMSVHIHGGMGFSEECAAHRYLKRAHLLRIIGEDWVAGLATPFERLAANLTASSG